MRLADAKNESLEACLADTKAHLVDVKAHLDDTKSRLADAIRARDEQSENITKTIDEIRSLEDNLRDDDKAVDNAARDYNIVIDALMDISSIVQLVNKLQNEIKDIKEGKTSMDKEKLMLFEISLAQLREQMNKMLAMMEDGR